MSENKLPTPRTDAAFGPLLEQFRDSKLLKTMRELELELAARAPSPAVREALPENIRELFERLNENQGGDFCACKLRDRDMAPEYHAKLCLDVRAAISGPAPAAPTYDDAVRALAPFLPDGWVAQDEDGGTCFYQEKPDPKDFEEAMWFTGSVAGEFFRFGDIPKTDWRLSLRRIEGKAVTP